MTTGRDRGRAASRRIGLTEPDALVVDIGLPTPTGATSSRRFVRSGVGAPVIFLTARDALPDRLAGFAAGGDDYLTKPFAFAELVARLRALVKRGGGDLAPSSGGCGSTRRRTPRRAEGRSST